MKKAWVFLVLLIVFVSACKDESVQKVIVTNPAQITREQETIELDWARIQKAVPGLNPVNVTVIDEKAGQPLVTQVIEEDDRAVLLFQTDFHPGQAKEFLIRQRPEAMEKTAAELTTYCRFIPERKDDFGWENDKTAFRMYGPALEDETITSGIDAWGKCVPYPIIDKFIKAYVDNNVSYHENHGEGGDFYKVGNTLGCGGAAPFVDGKVCLPTRNFVKWNVVANGPIRSVFEFIYDPWQAGTMSVSEKKRISIDLGSSLNRIECVYESSGIQSIPVAAGIVLRENSNQKSTENNMISYWLPADGNNGMMGCGVVFGSETTAAVTETTDHLLLTVTQKTGRPLVYYSGACWNKNKEFDSFEKWQQYLADFKMRLDNPVVIEMKN